MNNWEHVCHHLGMKIIYENGKERERERRKIELDLVILLIFFYYIRQNIDDS